MPPKVCCPICGGTSFLAGPKHRMAPCGALPRCAGCGSLERHRTFRTVLNPLALQFAERPVLQFSDDPALPRETFVTFELSRFGGRGHLDLMSIDRRDDSFGLIVCNHVLEHVEDDIVALRELDRILTDDGALFLSVPDLLRVARTKEYGRARHDKHGHWRVYGPDIVERWRAAVPEWAGIGVSACDPVTGEPDRTTLLSRSRATLDTAAARLADAGFSPFDAFA